MHYKEIMLSLLKKKKRIGIYDAKLKAETKINVI